jgi:hypothetical protein
MPNPSVLDAVWEGAEMSEVVGLYEKMCHMWEVDKGEGGLPLGRMKLMKSFTKDEQVRGLLSFRFLAQCGNSMSVDSGGLGGIFG